MTAQTEEPLYPIRAAFKDTAEYKAALKAWALHPDINMPEAYYEIFPKHILKARKVSALDDTPTRWLAKGWLPAKSVTILVGEEGIGKSLFWVYLAAVITTGAASPLLGFSARRKPRDVLVVVTEDTAGEVKARLEQAGADLERVHWFSAADDGTGIPVFGASPDDGDMLVLGAELDELKPALVVVDAWLDTVAQHLDLKNGQHARAAMHPWTELAKRHGCTMLLCTHANRLATANLRDLMGTSSVIRQVARMTLFAMRSPQDKAEGGRHVWIGPDKGNLSEPTRAVKFTIEVVQAREETDDDMGRTARLASPALCHGTMQQLAIEWKEEADKADRKPTKREQCEAAIRECMEDKPDGAPTDEIKTRLATLGYGKNTVSQAMADLGTSSRAGMDGPWTYRLDSF